MEYLIRKYRVLISLFVLFLLFSTSTIIIMKYFKPFISMVIVYFTSLPVYNLLLKIKINKKISSLLALLIINLVLLFTLIYLGGSLIKWGYKIYYENYNIISDLVNYLRLITDSNSNILGNVFSSIGNDSIKTGAVTTGETIISYFIGNISVFFLLTDREVILKYIYIIFPSKFFRQALQKRVILKQVVKIEVILVVLSMIEVTIAFKIFKINNYIQLGIICGILDVLPYVGTIIVFIPIIIYNIIVKHYYIAIGLTCTFILVQIIREFLEAKYLSDKLKLHPLLVLLSMYIGVKLFGVIGIIVGPLYSIFAKELVDNNVSNDA